MSHVTCHISHITCHIAHVICHISNAYVDSLDMLNNFCFHVYAQKWVFIIMSHVTFRLSHVTCYMWNAYVDPLDMLNNFCFHVYAQKWVFVISHVRCHMSHCASHYVKCLCWSLGHAEQLLFSCVSSKVTVYRLEWQCVFVLNKLYCVDMVVGRIVSMDVYVTCTV